MGLLQKARGGDSDSGARPPAGGGTPQSRRGFLERAESARETETIVRHCMDRLERLPVGGNSAYAALSIMKAYFPCTAELILAKKSDSTFQVVDSVGLNESACEEISVSLPFDIAALENQEYRHIDASVLGIDCLVDDKKAFIFPLGPDSSRCFVVVDSDEDNVKFTSISRILKANARIFAAKRCDDSNKQSNAEESASCDDNPARAAFAAFGGSFIIFTLSESSNDSLQRSARELLRSRLGTRGGVWELGHKAIAVFLHPELDRELYAHQLLKSMKSGLSLANEVISIAAEGSAASAAEAVESLKQFM